MKATKEEFESWLKSEHGIDMPELAYTFNPALWEGFQAGYKAGNEAKKTKEQK